MTIRDYMRIVENAEGQYRPEVLYHVTDEARFASIQRDGLDPSKSREPAFRGRYIYLSHDAGHAMAYVDHHGDWQGNAVLLAVNVQDLDPNLLGPDDVDLPDLLDQDDEGRDWSDLTWIESLEISGQCTYSGVIPPSAIRVYSDSNTDQEPLDEVRRTKALNSDGEEKAIAIRDTAGVSIGTIDGIEVRVDDGNVVFVTLIDSDKKTVGYADLVKRDGRIQVKMVRILKSLRGRRIVPKVFILLAQNGHVVESDIEQTAPAASMWAYLYDEAPRHGCVVLALKDGTKIELASPTKTVTGRNIYGPNTPFTLVLHAAQPK